MAAIIEPKKQDKGLEFNQAMGQVGQVFGAIRDARNDQAKLGLLNAANERQQESHDVTIKEKEAVIKHKELVDGHALASLQAENNGEVYLPNMENYTPADARAWKDHQLNTVAAALENTELKQAMMETKAKQWEMARKEILKDMQSAASEVQAGLEGGQTDWNNVWAAVERAYEKHHDGSDIVIAKDGKSYKVTYANGETANFSFSSEMAMYENFKSQATVLDTPAGYFQTMAKEDGEAMMRNAKELSKSGLWVNEEGIHAQVANMENRSGTGKIKKRIHIWKFVNGKVVDLGFINQAEFDKLGMMTIEDRAKSATIKKTEALTKKADKEATAAAKMSRSTEYKLAIDLVENISAYLQNAGGNQQAAIDEAMRHVMAIKSARDLNSAREFAVKTMGTDFNNKEEAAAFMKLYNSTRSALPSRKTSAPVKPTGLVPGEGGDVDVRESEAKPITKANTSQVKVANIKKRTEQLLKQGKTPEEIYEIISDEQHN